IGKIAGMDEAVLVNPDGYPLDDVEGARRLMKLAGDIGAIAGVDRREPLAPLLGREMMEFLHPWLDPEAGARVAGAVPAGDEVLQRRIAGRHVAAQGDQLVAALALLVGEPPTFQPQNLA